jgi:hypothetical protein
MADFKISGRMSVEGLQKQFKDNFGSSLRVYKGAVFADPKATLASIRTSDDKGGEFLVRGNMHVGTFEDEMLKRFGIRVQVSNVDDSKLLPNDMTLAASGKALSKAGKTNRSAGKQVIPGNSDVSEEQGDEDRSSGVEPVASAAKKLWDLSLLSRADVFQTACEGVCGADVGLGATFTPVSDFEEIIEYLNHIFQDDDVDYLFSFDRNGEDITLSGTTYLLRLGDAFDMSIDEYSEDDINEALHGIGLNEAVSRFIIKAWENEEHSIPLVSLVEAVLVRDNQVVEFILKDRQYGDTTYEANV